MKINLNFQSNIKWRGGFQTKLIFSILFFCLSEALIIAQNNPPFDYMPPTGNLIWSMPDAHSIYEFYMMDGTSNIPKDHDGLMVEFDIALDLNSSGYVPLLRIGYMDDLFLQFMYGDETVRIARFNNELKNNMICWYTYSSFDKLFDKTYSGVWNLRIYFTSRFIFIVSTNSKDSGKSYMTPFYFGIDYSQKQSLMSKFLKKEGWSWIWFGSDSLNETRVSKMKLYSFNYNDLYQKIQKEFSSPNPETGTGN